MGGFIWETRMNLALGSRRRRYESTHLELNTKVVLALRDGSLIGYAKIPAAQELPRAVRHRVGKHVVFLEGPGHAEKDGRG